VINFRQLGRVRCYFRVGGLPSAPRTQVTPLKRCFQRRIVPQDRYPWMTRALNKSVCHNRLRFVDRQAS
jgi:hypothetical protein